MIILKKIAVFALFLATSVSFICEYRLYHQFFKINFRAILKAYIFIKLYFIKFLLVLGISLYCY